jgi:hypothetical protein
LLFNKFVDEKFVETRSVKFNVELEIFVLNRFVIVPLVDSKLVFTIFVVEKFVDEILGAKTEPRVEFVEITFSKVPVL